MSGKTKISDKINKFAYIDGVLIGLILAKEFILDYIGLGLLSNAVICGCIILRLLMIRWRPPAYVIIALAVMPVLLLVSILQGGEILIALKNALRVEQVLFYGLYILFLLSEKFVYLRKCYNSAGLFLNAMLVVNIIVMFVQLKYPGSFQAVSDGNPISFKDSVSGLFGYGSTHAVAFFTAFIIVYNLDWYLRTRSWGVLLATAIETALSLYIATLNDNKALFVIVLFASLVFISINLVFRPRLTAYALLIIGGLAITVGALCFHLSPAIQSAFHEAGQWVGKISDAMQLDSYVNGSDERFKMVVYAPSLRSSWFLGEGIGAEDFYAAGFHGFNHFGQSDYGSIIILCGVWVYVALVLFYVRVTTAVPTGEKIGTQLVYKTAILLLILMSSIYIQPFTQVRVAIPFIMLAISFGMLWNDMELQKASRLDRDKAE